MPRCLLLQRGRITAITALFLQSLSFRLAPYYDYADPPRIVIKRRFRLRTSNLEMSRVYINCINLSKLFLYLLLSTASNDEKVKKAPRCGEPGCSLLSIVNKISVSFVCQTHCQLVIGAAPPRLDLHSLRSYFTDGHHPSLQTSASSSITVGLPCDAGSLNLP